MCVAFVVAGVIIVKNRKPEPDYVPEETVAAETTVVTTGSHIDSNVVFETGTLKSETEISIYSETNSDNFNGSESYTNRIYVDEEDGGAISGGFFEWR